MLRPLATATLVCLTLLPAASAQKVDWHVNADPARTLFRRSAFLHGYMHGYQEGFHAGDFDLQMGRGARDVVRLKEYREAKTGYAREFGDKARFTDGFRRGFRAGYGDATSGLEFRALDQARSVAAGMQEAHESFSTHFDEGVAAGFATGWDQGRTEPRPPGDLDSSKADCRAHAKDANEEFCNGFARGFRAGLLSGYDSQQSERAMSAAARP
jgi:hypothetical protein